MPKGDLGPFEAGTAYFGVQLRHINEGTGFRTAEGGFDQKTIARHAHLQTSTISRLVRGARANPYLDTVLRIAHAFDIEPAELMPSLAELKAMVAASGGTDAQP
jgi:DNA-binding XRE family transcriptional regulator